MSESLIMRVGAAAGITGGVIGAFAGIAHPQPEPGVADAFLHSIVPTSMWVNIHLAALFAVLLALVALVAIERSITREPARGLARFGLALAAAGSGAAIVWMAIDGVAMKHIADAWAAAPEQEKAVAFHTAVVVEEMILALFSITIVVWYGLPFIFMGLAVGLSGAYPRWMGWLVVAGAIGAVLTGMAQVYTGRTLLVTHILFPVVSFWIGGWVMLMSGFLWRKADAMTVVRKGARVQPVAPLTH